MLVLFDIDGTLLHAHGVGRRSIEAALTLAAGRPVTAEGVAFAGRTDPAIARDMLVRSGVGPAQVDGVLSAGLERYVAIVETALAGSAVTVLRGVQTLLGRLAGEPAVQLGLLTGNLRPSAYLKLRSGGLDGYFPFGAFGSDHSDRRLLPAVALRRAHEFTGRAFEPRDTVVVGDTEHDIDCGRNAGMHTVGVCTGPHARAALAGHRPDILLDTFADSGPLLRLLRLDA